MVLLRDSSARTMIQWLSWLGVAVGLTVVVTLQWVLREQGSTRTGVTHSSTTDLVLPRRHCGWSMDDDRDLTEMALTDCALHRLDTTIKEFSWLKQLDLAGNHLVDLPPLPPSLEVILLRGNRFERIPMPISTLPNLRMLSFKGCRLGELDLPLPPSLEWLILTNNGLRELPASLGRCTKLRKLMLSNNALTRLPDALAQLSALEVLRVANNNLAPPLPGWLFDGVTLPSLTWLAIAGNPAVEPAPALPSSFINGSELEAAEHDHLFLGEGASGVVHAVTWRQKRVAVKRFKTELTSDGKIADELRAAASVKHPNILQTIGFSLEPPIVVTEYDPSLKSLGGPPSLMSVTRDIYPEGTTFTAAFIHTVVRRTAPIT